MWGANYHAPAKIIYVARPKWSDICRKGRAHLGNPNDSITDNSPDPDCFYGPVSWLAGPGIASCPGTNRRADREWNGSAAGGKSKSAFAFSPAGHAANCRNHH